MDQCHICYVHYIDEGQDQSMEYRRKIVDTGSNHLFDELVIWSQVSVDQPLPFCSSCLQEVETIWSLSNSCNQIASKFENHIDNWTIKILESRKNIKTKGGLLLKQFEGTEIKVETDSPVKSNCVVCYSLFEQVESSPLFSSVEKKECIVKICKMHLVEPILNNECQFDWATLPSLTDIPFCESCVSAIEHFCRIDTKITQTRQCLKTFVHRFSLDSLKRKSKATKKTEAPDVDSKTEVQFEEFDILGDTALEATTIINVSEEHESNMGTPLGKATDPPYYNMSPIIVSSSSVEKSQIRFLRNNASTPSTSQVSSSRQTSSFGGQVFEEASSSRRVESEQLTLDVTTTHHRRMNTDDASHSPALSFDSEMPTLVSYSNPQPITDLFHCRVAGCKQEFESADILEAHMYIHSDISKPFKCKGCDETFANKTQLNKHHVSKNSCDVKPRKVIDHGPKLKYFGRTKRVSLFQCKFCLTKMASARELSGHNQSHYDEAVETRCELCKIVYGSKTLLEKHFKTRHDPQNLNSQVI